MTVRQSSYSEAARHLGVVFQTNTPVQEYELNESGMIAANLAASGVKYSGGDGVSDPLTLTSPGANQLQLSAFSFVVDGIYVNVTTTSTITGLTTPGTARADELYVELSMTEVADPTPLSPLGVVSRRKKLSVSFKVIEGGTTPASTGRILDGGIQRYRLALLPRLGANTSPLSGAWSYAHGLVPKTSLSNITAVLNGVVERIYSGSSGIVDRKDPTALGLPLGFHDGNLLNDRVNLTDKLDTTAGKVLLNPANVIPSAVTETSIIRKLNGRPFVTVGDGSQSFGDVNGAGALEAVCAAFWAEYPGQPLVVVVKRGNHSLGANLVGLGPLTLIGEQTAGTGVQISTAGGIITTDYALSIENITFVSGVNAITVTDNTTTGGGFRLRGCTVYGIIRYYGDGGAVGLAIDDCTLIATSDAEPLQILQSDAISNHHGVRVSRTSIYMTANAGALVGFGRSSGTGLSTFREVVFQECTFYTPEAATPGSPQPTRGVVRFYDSNVLNSVWIESMTFRDCRFQSHSNGGPWWDQDIGKRDGTTSYTSVSYISRLSFDKCIFDQTERNNGGPSFKLVARAYTGATTEPASSVSFSGCIFRLNGYQCADHGELAANKAVIYVRAHRVYMTDCVMTGARDGIFTGAAAPPLFSSWIQLSPFSHESPDGVAYGKVKVRNLTFEVTVAGSGTTTAAAALGVHTLTDSFSAIDIEGVEFSTDAATPLVGTVIRVLSQAASIRVRGCTIRSGQYQEAPLAIQAAAYTGSQQNIEVSNNLFVSVKGPTYVASNASQSLVLIRGNTILAGGSTALENGLSASATGANSHLRIDSNVIDSFAAYAVTTNAPFTVMTANLFRANNSGGAQNQVVAVTHMTMIGNSALTSAGAQATLDFTSAAASPTASNSVGADTADVTSMGTFTNNQALRLNNAKLVH